MFVKAASGLSMMIVWLMVVTTVWAQTPTPRPTPTNIAPPGGGNGDTNDSNRMGSISGFIYEDVNRDGRCVNTGVAGENPVEGLHVQFVSSDQQTVITHYSGANGDFGLYPAGQSYWEVSVLPADGWTVTSERVVYVPVYVESLNHENVNFCVTKGTNAVINLPAGGVATGGGTGTVLLPESGASAAELAQQTNSSLLWGLFAVGIVCFVVGIYLERRRYLLRQ